MQFQSLLQGNPNIVNGTNSGGWVKDEASTNNGAVAALHKLIDVHNIYAVIGPTRSASALACAPIANQRRVVLITPTAGSPKIADAGDFVFRTRESGELQSQVLARYVVDKLKISSVSILHPQEENALGYKEAFAGEFTRVGGTISAVAGFPEDKTDLRTEIQKIVAGKPGAIYIPGTAVHIARALKQCRELGIEARFLSSVGAENPELLQVAGDAAEGLLYSGMAFDPNDVHSSVQSFVREYETKYGRYPNAWAANAYDATMIVAKILDSGVADGPDVRDALYATKEYPGVGGTIAFDARGEAIKPVAIKQIQNRRFKLLEVIK